MTAAVDALPLQADPAATAEFANKTAFQELKAALLSFAFPPGSKIDDPVTPAMSRRRLRLAARIDRLHAAGAPWPCFDADLFWTRSGRPRPFTPTSCGVERRRSRRPENGYCVRWNGAFWVPCVTQKERRDAGYVMLLMAWHGTQLRAGAILMSGMHARFAYAIREVEQFEAPSGPRGYTCRLWCDRSVANPDRLPSGVKVHTFQWFPRKAKKR